MLNRNQGQLFSMKNPKNKFLRAGNDLLITYSILHIPSLFQPSISIQISFISFQVLFRPRTGVIRSSFLEKHSFTNSHMLAIGSWVKLSTANLALF